MFRSTFLVTLGLGLFLLILDDINKNLQLNKMEEELEANHLFTENLIQQTDNEIAFYILRDSELTDQNKLLLKTVTASDLKQTKIKEVREIVKKTIISLPNTEYYREARNLSGTDISKIAKSLVEYSDQYDVPLSLAVALVRHESAFNTRAISRVGAQGLAQLMPATADMVGRQLGKQDYDPWDSQKNLQFGLFYFSTLLDLYRGHPEQYKLAVNAYNAGPGNVFKVLHRETVEHETYIFKYASEFKEKGL